MSELQKFCDSHKGRVLRKWTHYLPVYERFFQPYKNTPIVFLEIGVFKGGSLQMWKSYFAPNSRIIGIDIDPTCKKFEEENIEIHIGSQDNKEFIQDLLSRIPPPDIILDDGGHLVRKQIRSFQLLFPHLKQGGLYICEDVHTSYWMKYGGGLRRMGTFMEYMKKRIDDLHAWHFEPTPKKLNSFTQTISAITFYNSIVILEKERIEPPQEKWFGQLGLEVNSAHRSWWKIPIVFFLDILNRILQILKLPSIYYGR